MLGRPRPPVSYENLKFAVLGRSRPRPIPSPGSPRPRTSCRPLSHAIMAALNLSFGDLPTSES